MKSEDDKFTFREKVPFDVFYLYLQKKKIQ